MSPVLGPRADNDHLVGGTQNSRTTEFELSASGPIVPAAGFTTLPRCTGLLHRHAVVAGLPALSVPEPVERTTQRLRQDRLPALRRRSGWAFRCSCRTMTGTTTSLPGASIWTDFRRRSRTSYRLAAMLSHSVSDEFYYTASLSRYYLRSRIGEGDEDVPVRERSRISTTSSCATSWTGSAPGGATRHRKVYTGGSTARSR